MGYTAVNVYGKFTIKCVFMKFAALNTPRFRPVQIILVTREVVGLWRQGLEISSNT